MFALLAFPVHTVLLNFYDTYKRWLVRGNYTSVAFLLFSCAAEQQGGNNALIRMEEFLCGYFSSAIVDVRDWILVTRSANKIELKSRVLQKAMSKILFKIKKIFCRSFLVEVNRIFVSSVSHFWHHTAATFQKEKIWAGYDTNCQ